MNTNNPDTDVFVLAALADGMESFATVMSLLNDRWGGWRNRVTKDFSLVDVLTTLEQAIEAGLVDVVEPSGPLSDVKGGAKAMLAMAQADPVSTWLRLTEKGRETLDVRAIPEGTEHLLIEHLRSSPLPSISLRSAYHLASQQFREPLDFVEFAAIVNSVLEHNYVRLWHATGASQERTRLTSMPQYAPELYTESTTSEPDVLTADSMGYYLTLGDKGARVGAPVAQEPLAPIPDPLVLLQKLKERKPRLLEGFAGRKTILHIVIDERDSVTVGVGPLSQFIANVRWGKGLPENEGTPIRHLMLDETGKVLADYYGPASLDPLDKETDGGSH